MQILIYVQAAGTKIEKVLLDGQENDHRHADICGVMDIVIGNGLSDMSSSPGQDHLHFTYC